MIDCLDHFGRDFLNFALPMKEEMLFEGIRNSIVSSFTNKLTYLLFFNELNV